MTDGGRFYNTRQVALLLGVSAATVRSWLKEFGGYFKPKRVRGLYQFSEEDVIILHRIRTLLKEELYTLEGAKRQLGREIESLIGEDSLKAGIRAIREELSTLKETFSSEVRAVRSELAVSREAAASKFIATIPREEIKQRKLRKVNRYRKLVNTIFPGRKPKK
ncbi:MAG: MerR family transcriptional regulator [Firmicutes bacterium]|nr:MerR family transcriptional regulator [Bacillota bacterium]